MKKESVSWNRRTENMPEPKKICLIVQRYGLEVNGGAELLARQIAEKMTAYYDVTVLSSCAIDYMTWENVYPHGKSELHGVHLIRFPVSCPRNNEEFNEINARFMRGELSRDEEIVWLEKEGPYVPELIGYLRDHADSFDAFLFFTYLYYPTVMGIPVVRDKAIVFPLAHNEPFLKMNIFDSVFLLPKAFFFETEEERSLVRRKYLNYCIPGFIGGAGVDVPDDVSSERFRDRYGIRDPYIIYVGRIDTGKNCEQMFDQFIRYKEENPSELKLVLMGKPVISIPEHKDIISLGFVSDEDKFDGISGSEFLLLPSRFESLSIVVLEAFALHRPVVVNGECEVLKAHCEQSQGGLYYLNDNDFKRNVSSLLQNRELQKQMGDYGYAYVQEKYSWNRIIGKLCDLIAYIQQF